MIQRVNSYVGSRVGFGDCSQRAAVEQLQRRGLEVTHLIDQLIHIASAAFTMSYTSLISRMDLAGHETCKQLCEDARLAHRACFERIVPRIYELGGQLPRHLHDSAIGGIATVGRTLAPPTAPARRRCWKRSSKPSARRSARGTKSAT